MIKKILIAMLVIIVLAAIVLLSSVKNRYEVYKFGHTLRYVFELRSLARKEPSCDRPETTDTCFEKIIGQSGYKFGEEVQLAGKFLVEKQPHYTKDFFRALQALVKNIHPNEWWIANDTSPEAAQIFFNEKLDLKAALETYHRAALRNTEPPELQDEIEGYAIALEKKITELSQ